MKARPASCVVGYSAGVYTSGRSVDLQEWRRDCPTEAPVAEFRNPRAMRRPRPSTPDGGSAATRFGLPSTADGSHRCDPSWLPGRVRAPSSSIWGRSWFVTAKHLRPYRRRWSHSRTVDAFPIARRCFDAEIHCVLELAVPLLAIAEFEDINVLRTKEPRILVFSTIPAPSRPWRGRVHPFFWLPPRPFLDFHAPFPSGVARPQRANA